MNRESRDLVVCVCAANARYAIPLAVMLRSAADYLDPGRELLIYVVDDGIGGENKRRIGEQLPSRARVKWITPRRSEFTGLPLWGRMTVTTYNKLAVAELLPAAVQKIIWLDCDMLVLHDIAELWDLPTNGCHAMAVQDSLVPSVSSRFGVAGFRDLGLDRKAPYFNAGLMVIDLDRWRTDDILRQALDYLKRYADRVFFWDQEALNAVLAGKWGEIDTRWNWSANLERLARPSRRSADGNSTAPWIVHFNGNLKPWTVLNCSAFDAHYLRTLDETAWTGWRPQRKWSNMLLGWYGSSPLRRLIYPAEQLGVRMLRRFTFRYVKMDDE